MPWQKLTKQTRHIILFVLTTCAHGVAQRESLTIGAGDIVHVRVLEEPELDQTLRVLDSGDIDLITGGRVKVENLTPGDAARIIEKALIRGQFVVTPHVSVTFEQTMSKNVTVIGEVRNPGTYPIETTRGVLNVLSQAGGLSELADRHLTIQKRTTGELFKFYLSNDAGEMLQDNLLISPGDTIVVSRARVVYVLGDVKKPGGYAMTTNDSQLTALEALSLAGGTPPTAVPSHASLVRKNRDGSFTQVPLALSKMQKGKTADVKLEANDIIYVPFSYLKNTVLNIGGILAAAGSAAVYRF
jgi:polysaccharide export outer membrane protein